MVVQADGRARQLAEAEAEARDSQLRFRLLAENLTDMVVLSDRNAVRQYVSPACRDLLGYEPSELVETRPHDMLHPDEAERFHETMQLLRNGISERVNSTHRFLRKDGRYVWVEMEARVLRDSVTGAPTGFVSAVRDISQRHRQAEELLIAKDAAEAGLRARSDFLASMSHELRTPLNGIIGFTGLMIESGELRTPLMHRYARLVQDASRTLLSIVNDVLDVSKMEAGSLELDPRPFSVRHLLASTAELMREQAGAKGLELRVEVGEDLPSMVIADDSRLGQVLLNLVSNAVKFTAQGKVVIRATCVGQSAERSCICFSVSDTGIGIPSAKRHRLFKRFSQVDSSTARQYGGTGLGLSICKSLVELMGGAIEVESIEGEGSTFSFNLDLPIASLTKETGHSEPLQGNVSHVTGLRILLAEDIPMNRELIIAVLTRWGHEVDVAEDGIAAVDAVRRRDYDLVLMDVQMPGMDGMEATQRIRAMGGRNIALPILAMTANVLTEDLVRFKAASMDDHVGKPFDPAQLRSTLDRWTRDRNRTAEENSLALAPSVTDSNVAVVNLDVFASLQAMLDVPSIRSLLSKFQDQLRTRLTLEPSNSVEWERVRFDAHALISPAGMLGFQQFSALCADLERSCIANQANADAAAAILIMTQEAKVAAAEKAQELLESLMVTDAA
jgi:PAS domain S-box-containing protein